MSLSLQVDERLLPIEFLEELPVVVILVAYAKAGPGCYERERRKAAEEERPYVGRDGEQIHVRILSGRWDSLSRRPFGFKEGLLLVSFLAGAGAAAKRPDGA